MPRKKLDSPAGETTIEKAKTKEPELVEEKTAKGEPPQKREKEIKKTRKVAEKVKDEKPEKVEEKTGKVAKDPLRGASEPRSGEREEEAVSAKKGEVFYGTGRRKTSIASVWLKMEKGELLVNSKPIKEYFPKTSDEKIYEEPMRVVNRLGQFSATIKISGGGISSQLGALVHGLSRALASVDETYREILSKKKFLTRDSRMKERRKYGHAGKARKMKQSPKR
jgi:small subunit ribosomal protein S9